MRHKIAILAVLAIILTIFTTGCSEPPPADEGEVLAAAEKLLTDAIEVNRIFFWEGLPHTGKSSDSWMDQIEGGAETGSPTTGDDFDLGDAEYYVLTEEYRYLSPTDLIDKAAAVYTEGYTEDIYEIAFEGVASGNENVDVLYARYVTEMGEMKINRRIVESALPESIPDTATLKAVKLRHNSAIVSAEFTCEGAVTVREITLKLEAEGWRLDTPTY